jgi:hypothetical protein
MELLKTCITDLNVSILFIATFDETSVGRKWFEKEKEPWSLLLEISHIGRLRDQADQNPCLNSFLVFRQIFKLHGSISQNEQKAGCKNLSSSELGFKPWTYTSA